MLQDIRTSPARTVNASAGRNGGVSVEVKGLVKRYGAVVGVAEVDFHLEAGKTATLLGPSGCGKTTTLRCIAGLEMPNEGQIHFGDRKVYDSKAGISLEPEQRNIGMVFQSYAIWPHMTVAGNVGYPLRVRRAPKAEVAERVNTILSLVGLGEMGTRPAANLSGGQQQRVALARALVHQPGIVLFDEPLSNLDANLRERMRAELLLLQAELGFTAIYVTHDQEEAMALSNVVVVMNKGEVEQTGSPSKVFQEPATLFAARFLGCSNVIPGEIASVGTDGAVTIEMGNGVPMSGTWRDTVPPKVGEAVDMAFRPGVVAVEQTSSNGANTISGQVLTAAFLGHSIDYTIKVGELTIRAETSPDAAIPVGSIAQLRIPSRHAFVYGRAS
jgi:iron(III) transport system ATP-binding protein